MDSDLSFGDWVRRRRKSLDLTQEALADLVGCSYSAIRKIEAGVRRPSTQIAELLAIHLKIDEAQRARFLQVARGVMSVEKLSISPSGLQLFDQTQGGPASAIQTFIPPTNLPAAPTSFIGRAQDIATLSRLIRDPHCRLITLLGQGGMGKTRLSIHVASQSLDAFDGRVYLVQLAPLTSPDALLPAIVSLFGLTAQNTDLKTRLIGYLREKHILLVLDNFEHLMPAVDFLNELLTQAPQLKLLVTSRERLNIQGEWTLELSGLTTPPEVGSSVGEYDALILFEQSVRRARPEFQFTIQDREAAIRICNLVEGLPLAIEIAAAWVTTLPCAEIASEIEKTFDFLQTSQRNLPERHKSLRAVFDHSWQLLTDEERLALSRLSIFQGGFSREAANMVAGASLEVLSSLLAKSLIRRAEEGRFDMHEAIRQYASIHLELDAALHEAHACYYITLLRDLEKLFKSADHALAIQTLTNEFANIHAAWGTGIQYKLFALMNEALLMFWGGSDLLGRAQEGYRGTDALAHALRQEPRSKDTDLWLGRALAYHAMFCYRMGDYPRGRTVIEESLALLRSLRMPRLLIEPLIYSSIIYGLTGNLSAAQDNVNEGVMLAKEFNDMWFLTSGQFNQGYIARVMGNGVLAYQALKSALALSRQVWNLRLLQLSLNFLSSIAIEMDAREEARTYLEENLQLASQYQDRLGMGFAYRGFGVLALREGDFSGAESYLNQSVLLFKELGARGDLAESLTNLGKLHMCLSEFNEAQTVLKEAIRLGLDSNAMPQVYAAAVELADCLLNVNRMEDASAIMSSMPDSALKIESVRARAEEVREEVGLFLGEERRFEELLMGLVR